jgi:hypothetical protein
MCLTLKNGCETSRCLVVDSWNNNESDRVIVVIAVTVSLVVNDDHIVQDSVSTHDQPETS